MLGTISSILCVILTTDLSVVFIVEAQNNYPSYGNYDNYYGNEDYQQRPTGDPVECGGELTENEGTITSPGYPSEENPSGSYPPYADCVWHRDGVESTLMQLKFWDMGVEIGEGDSNITCDFDSVNVSITSIGWKLFCGYETYPNELQGSGTLLVHFRSDHSVNYRGFVATYQVTEQHNPCEPSPCNNGVCELDEAGLLPFCVCDEGYTGEQCTIDISGCASDPCQNGGTCNETEDPNVYTCDCPLEWEGKHCERERDSPCNPSPCVNGASCVVIEIVYYKCECLANYEGENCETGTGCGNPGISEINELRRFAAGDTLQFYCDEGFVLSGPSNASACSEDGSWSLDIPRCLENSTDVKNQQDQFDKAWKSAMIGMSVAFGVNLVVFSFWMIYRGPWRKIGQDLSVGEKPHNFRQKQDNFSVSTITISDDDFSDSDDDSSDNIDTANFKHDIS